MVLFYMGDIIAVGPLGCGHATFVCLDDSVLKGVSFRYFLF